MMEPCLTMVPNRGDGYVSLYDEVNKKTIQCPHYNTLKTQCGKCGSKYDEENTHLNAKGQRSCKACGRVRSREYQRAKRRRDFGTIKTDSQRQ